MELAQRLGVSKSDTPSSQKDSLLFACDVLAAFMATTLSAPFNYARNLIYAHPEGLTPLNTRGRFQNPGITAINPKSLTLRTDP